MMRLELLRYSLSNSIAAYESRKQVKKLFKIQSGFLCDSLQLQEHSTDMSILVPSLFAKMLKINTYKFIEVKNQDQNYFENSYVNLKLPLSSSKSLTQILNKLNTGEIRIGRLFELMDSIAGIVSYRHCFGSLLDKNPNVCVTGSVESFHIFQKIKLNEDLMIEGYLNNVGKTSMEVEINLYQSGILKCNTLFTMISRDASDHSKGYQVPTLILDHLSEREQKKAIERLENAKLNIVRRKIEMSNSYDKKPPTQSEMEEIHSLFLQRKNLTWNLSQTIPINQTVLTNVSIMHHQLRNVHGKIFGGHLMKEMLEIGWILGCRYTGQLVEIQDLANIYFKKPTEVGTRLTLKAQVTYVHKNITVITVEAYSGQMMAKGETLTCFLHIIVSSKNHQKQVHPESYEEALQFLSSRKEYQNLFYS